MYLKPTSRWDTTRAPAASATPLHQAAGHFGLEDHRIIVSVPQGLVNHQGGDLVSVQGAPAVDHAGACLRVAYGHSQAISIRITAHHQIRSQVFRGGPGRIQGGRTLRVGGPERHARKGAVVVGLRGLQIHPEARGSKDPGHGCPSGTVKRREHHVGVSG